MAIETNEIIDVQTLPPFKKFIMTIGNIPTSYLESMTYAELLMWFCNYLQETVIPTVNNNAEAVSELQGLFIELKSYVDNYFENLDVQSEINKKLDEMATDGTLTGLLSTYLVPIINEQNRQISEINDKVEAGVSGSHKGVYSTVEDLETADPDHDYIYVVTATGNWYYYDTTDTEWKSGGTYQASVSTDDVTYNRNLIESVYNILGFKGNIVEYENKTISTSTGTISESNTRLLTKDYLPDGITKIYIASGYTIVLVVFDNTDTYKGIYRTGTHTIEPSSSLNWTQNSLTVPYDLLSTGDKLKVLMRSSAGTSITITTAEASNLSYSYKLLEELNKTNSSETELSNLYDSTGLTPISYDDDFDHNNPIYIYKVDDEYTTNFDPSINKYNTSNPVYIAPDGNDLTGNGSEGNPYQTLEQALSVEDVDTIYLKHGVYYLGTNFTNGLIINQAINLIGDDSTIYFGDSTNGLNEAGIMRFRKSIYCEGITFYGGRGLVVEVTTDVPTFVNCTFRNSNQNGLNFRGLGCYLVNCKAFNNDLDGFNYHAYNNVAPTGIVEINCKGYNNGNISNRSSNGSTIHENGRIIRLKCEYYLNHGGNLADSESMSYNFDVNSYNSKNYNEIHYNANYQSLTNSEIWLYNCMGAGSIYQLSAITSSTINTDGAIANNYIYKDANSVINILN